MTAKPIDHMLGILLHQQGAVYQHSPHAMSENPQHKGNWVAS
jgi:hypothetical protein